MARGDSVAGHECRLSWLRVVASAWTGPLVIGAYSVRSLRCVWSVLVDADPVSHRRSRGRRSGVGGHDCECWWVRWANLDRCAEGSDREACSGVSVAWRFCGNRGADGAAIAAVRRAQGATELFYRRQPAFAKAAARQAEITEGLLKKFCNEN